VAVLPTGAGKSAIYELAGLLRTGPTVVVSPLIALEDDQLAQLHDAGLSELAVEDHGRAVTTNASAAAWYRRAQRAVDLRVATAALRFAVETDPTFGLAAADLAAITRSPAALAAAGR
jgi:hypothetical protein